MYGKGNHIRPPGGQGLLSQDGVGFRWARRKCECTIDVVTSSIGYLTDASGERKEEPLGDIEVKLYHHVNTTVIGDPLVQADLDLGPYIRRFKVQYWTYNRIFGVVPIDWWRVKLEFKDRDRRFSSNMFPLNLDDRDRDKKGLIWLFFSFDPNESPDSDISMRFWVPHQKVSKDDGAAYWEVLHRVI